MLVGSGEAIGRLKSYLEQVAAADATLLIQGESGTGKELIARWVHANSRRASGQFVPINCAAIPAELLESELFGHRKGAFTGAIADRKGRFELAHGGTLFLDEIGDMPVSMQVKLLRVLQERCVEPVGSHASIAIDVRIVAATHQDLEEQVRQGDFREDLFFRLNVLPLRVPPLRERMEDLPELIAHLASKFAGEGSPPIRLSPFILEHLAAYDWPGNVRELSNLIQRFSVLFPGQYVDLPAVPLEFWPARMRPALSKVHLSPPASPSTHIDAALESVLEPAQLPSDEEQDGDAVTSAILLGQGWMDLPAGGLHLRNHLAQVEAELIRQALRVTGGNVSQAARLLKMQRTTLIEKIAKYKLGSGGRSVNPPR